MENKLSRDEVLNNAINSVVEGAADSAVLCRENKAVGFIKLFTSEGISQSQIEGDIAFDSEVSPIESLKNAADNKLNTIVALSESAVVIYQPRTFGEAIAKHLKENPLSATDALNALKESAPRY